MSEPKFVVGEAVGVCTRALEIVIPRTTVTNRKKIVDDKLVVDPITGDRFLAPKGWAYQVADGPKDKKGDSLWYMERVLRPLDPEDYVELVESEEKNGG